MTETVERKHSECSHLWSQQNFDVMATVNSIDNGSVVWETTNGNVVTFRVNADVNLSYSDTCIKLSHNPHANDNFPSDVPEIHYHISSDSSGTNVVAVSELIDVTMDDIWDPVAVKLVIKEGGTTKGEHVYSEDPQNVHRNIYNDDGVGVDIDDEPTL